MSKSTYHSKTQPRLPALLCSVSAGCWVWQLRVVPCFACEWVQPARCGSWNCRLEQLTVDRNTGLRYLTKCSSPTTGPLFRAQFGINRFVSPTIEEVYSSFLYSSEAIYRYEVPVTWLQEYYGTNARLLKNIFFQKLLALLCALLRCILLHVLFHRHDLTSSRTYTT